MANQGEWFVPVESSERPSSSSSLSAPMRLVVLAGLMFSLTGGVGGLTAMAVQPAGTPAKPIRNTPPKPAPGAPGGQPARPVQAPGNQFPANQPPGAVPIGQPVPAQPGMQPMQPAQPLQPVVMPEGFKPEMTATSLKFGPFAEPVQVRLLVDLVAQALNLQIMDVGLALQDKKVSLITQIEVPKKDLLSFLNLLLEQNGQTITRDIAGVFIIRPFGEFGGGVGNDQFSATRIIPTPGLKPSSLQAAISVAVRSGPPGQGQAQQSIAYLDDLGVILVTDAPRRIQQLEELIAALVKQQNDVQWLRIPVKYLSAADARTRVLELLGRVAQNTGTGFNPNLQNGQPIQVPNPNLQGGGGAGGTLSSISNLPDRLLISNDSNDLLFRGQSDEVMLLHKALETVDVASSLKGKFYNVGGAAQAIANIASNQGLGSVQTFQNGNNLGGVGNFLGNQQNQQALQLQGFGGQGTRSDSTQGGSRFVIDGQGRGFMYYGTDEQQLRLQQIVDEYAPLLDSERVTYEFYRLRHGKAETIAEIVRGLISNQVPTGSGDGSAFLPSSNNAANRINTQNATRRTPAQQARAAAQPGGANGGTDAIQDTQDVFVLQYKDTNTVVVKAPARLQPQFKNLIDKLDQRRPQVYIDAKIVVVTGSDDVRLAVETQLVNASGKGGVLRTIFPPSATQTSTVSGNIIVPPVVSPLTGFTAALIRSDMTPVVITAIQNLSDARVVASPKLLVDDNEEAKIISKEQRPTTTQTQIGGTGTNNVIGFGGYEDAGPELTVTPQISSGDYLRLKYKLNLSNFIGEATPGNPPPKQNNEISSDSVTIPSDSTIVVGGLTFDQDRKTVVQVPLLGDIPILGNLFKDERTVKTTSVIYVFLTPRIMRDEQFEDLRLLTKGPMKASKIKEELPDPNVTRMEIHGDPESPPTDLQFIERRREDEEQSIDPATAPTINVPPAPSKPPVS